MKNPAYFKRTSALICAVAATAMTLAACGSDDNSANSKVDQSAVARSTASCEGKAKLSAAGSSAQDKAISEFVKAYKAACAMKGKNDVDVAYNPKGSGDGRSKFTGNLVDFAGSDSALKEPDLTAAKTRCGGNEAWHIPLVFGPVAIAYNLDSVGKLVLNGETIAKIFNGGITNWNDPAIAALNGGTKLPDLKISVVYRQDSSGTTDNFQQYLAAVAPGAWKAEASGSEFKGGVGSGSNQSAGVAQAVGATPGSITYVEKSFAQGKLKIAQINTGNGAVELNKESTKKAIESVQQKTPGSKDLVLDLKKLYASKYAGVYPLMLTTYEIVCSKGYPSDVATGVKSFLTSAANEGQSPLEAVGYVPLPDSFKAKTVESINAIS